MANSSVIFIPNDETLLLNDDYSVVRRRSRHFNSSFISYLFFKYFNVPLTELLKRFLMSMIPPLGQYRKVHVDFIGPLFALAALSCILQYGHANKLPMSTAGTSPVGALLLYVGLTVPLAYFLSRVGKAGMTLAEIIALLGYSLFGHILTLSLSLLVYHEESNAFFFFCLIIFGGPCTLRLVLVLLTVIPVPAARLLVCSIVALLHLLSLVFFHFAYMHRTFSYGRGHVYQNM